MATFASSEIVKHFETALSRYRDIVDDETHPISVTFEYKVETPGWCLGELLISFRLGYLNSYSEMELDSSNYSQEGSFKYPTRVTFRHNLPSIERDSLWDSSFEVKSPEDWVNHFSKLIPEYECVEYLLKVKNTR